MTTSHVFNIYMADGRIRIYQRRYQCYADSCVQYNRFGGGGVMVWATINHNVKTKLVIVNGNLNARQYVDRILRPVIRPQFRQRPGLTYQHDNAHLHMARVPGTFWRPLQSMFSCGLCVFRLITRLSMKALGRRQCKRRQPRNVRTLEAALCE